MLLNAFDFLQWECKTDMSSKYRFGSIVVTCEGYNHPDDPYVLKGSCGVCFLHILIDIPISIFNAIRM